MARVTKSQHFPPEAIADLSKASASGFMKLVETLEKREFALVLGAGVSNSAGLPAWTTLLYKICSAFFYHWEWELQHGQTSTHKPPQNLSIAFANEIFWSKDSVRKAEAFITGDPLLVAQQIKNCIRPADWKWLLRRALYDIDDLVQHDGSPSELIKMISSLCAIKAGRIRAVISYNYDDLLELCLEADHVPYKPIYAKPIRNTAALPIFHPHGYLPIHGGPAESTFVLSEDDYVQNASQPFSWSNLVQLETFAQYPCIFIGASMKDTALRRLLRLSRTTHMQAHFAFLPASEPMTQQSEMFDALFDHDLKTLGVYVVRYRVSESPKDRHERLLKLLGLAITCSCDRKKIWDIRKA